MKTNAQKMPSFIEPMKALPVQQLPAGDWLHEIKFDGYRALAFKDGKHVRPVSRIKTGPATSTTERTEFTADRLLGVAMML